MGNTKELWEAAYNSVNSTFCDKKKITRFSMALDIVTLNSFFVCLFTSSLDHNFLILSFFFPRASNRLRFCIPCITCLSCAMLCFIIQSCLILCKPMDCSPPGSSVHGIFQVRIPEWVSMPSSRGIFPTQGSYPSLPQCRWILYPLKPWEAMGPSHSYIKRKVSTEVLHFSRCL